MTVESKPQPWRFSVSVLIPIVIVAGLACLALGFVLSQAVREADAIAAERQAENVRHAITSSIEQVPHDQESVAYWDTAVLKTRENDATWIDDNLGTWMYDYFAHDKVYVLDNSDRVTFSMSAGEVTTGEERPETMATIVALADLARDPKTAEAHEREHDALDASLGPRARKHSNVPHVTEIMIVDGRPAVVSAMLIVPHTDMVTVDPSEEYVHVSLQFLDGAFLAEIATAFLLNDARFTVAGESDPGRSVAPIRNMKGETIGALTWLPEKPGSQILAAILLSGIVACLVIAVLVGALLRWLHRFSAALETSRAQAQHLAFHDALTGLPNRHYLIDRLDAIVAKAIRGERGGALLLLDLDRFKNVNDTYGHHAGDTLIQEFAGRLSAVVAKGDVLARLGGDEFAIIVADADRAQDLDAYCTKILGTVFAPFAVSGGRAVVGVSAGAAQIVQNADRHELLRRADIALYAAKRAGRNRYHVFEPGMDEHVRQRHFIEQELRMALDTGNGLSVHYQPKISSRYGVVVGLEALARWWHPDLGQVSPSVFVPVAEECGLIGRLDEWVLRRATVAAGKWPNVSIAVNISADAFRTPGVATRILKALADTNFNPTRLEIEITETVLVEISDITISEIDTLRAAGVGIALDDFGTGYSSLNHLRRFQVDRIKVDKSFVQHLGQTADSTVIVSAVVRLGHTMGVSVTAEGVETEGQRDFLRSIGCDEMQGYFFAAPAPEEEIPGLLQTAAARAVA